MADVVWKYELRGNVVDVEMPLDARIIHVEAQREVPCIWAVVDPGRRLETRRFVTVGTGQNVPEGSFHVGTFFMLGGDLVWHVFEVVP